ncbi:SusC/RagA family TonB-linked outer membrane protein [Zunongwangia pacifica]|uniref:TonB-dependent receptor n=1 Tax=Zunongwangia pacifica TaxID=2911062 RepID=A0A9X2CR59_9FLAO|nr:TonB-dependent receptor [Zunongwangia pacifica]MCL6220847.1 TonB-dependent receptor [Zunongwangia pacifica]
MKKNLGKILMLFLLLAVQTILAQEKEIRGTIIDDQGLPLPGVNVIEEGTRNGVQSDFDGNYKIEVSEGATLSFSYVGFATQNIKVGSQSTIDVTMEVNAAALDEVIVTGYGKKKTVKETSAASVVTAKAIEDRPIVSVNDMLKGNSTGVVVTGGSGQPGAKSSVQIRGISSLNAGTSPLYVIDGVPVISGDYTRNSTSADVLSSINNNDIESISILKDASATALYGARAANGAILITTKQGKSGAPKFNLSLETGFNEKAVDGPGTLNSSEWAEITNEGLVNVLGEDYANYVQENINPKGINSDWANAVERGSAMQQQANFSVTGGTDRLRYYSSIGYFDQESIIKNSFFNRTSGRVKIDYDLSDKISIGQNISASFSNMKSLANGGGFSNPMLAKYFARPSDPVRNEDGSFFIGNDLNNPRLSNGLFNVPMLLENNFAKAKTLKLQSITDFSYEITDHLTYTSRLSLDNTVIEEDEYQNPRHGDGFSVQGRAYAYDTRVFNYVFQNTLSYDFTLEEDHNFNILLVQEAQKNQYRDVSAASEGFGKEGFTTVSVGSNNLEALGKREQYTNAAYLINLTYDYDNKYFFDASYRREGNSNFAKNNKWGDFYSVSLAWDIAKEEFFRNTSVSQLKIRTSYGEVGNASIGSTSSLAYFKFDGQYNGRIPLYVGGVENPDLTWEKNKPFNVGVDFGFLDNRITGTFDYFVKKTEDLLYAIPLSLTSGANIELEDGTTQVSQFTNAGSLENRGFEASIGAQIFDNDFKWNTRLNLSYVQNELLDLVENDVISGTKILREGESINTYFMRKWAGVDPANGNPLWYVNGKGGETTSDYSKAERAVQGNSLPNYTGGFNNSFSYKGITLQSLFTFALDYKVYDSWATYLQSGGVYNLNYPGYANNLDRWQKPGDIAKNPRTVYNTNNQNNATSTRYLYDGDFIRLSNLQIGYDLANVLNGDLFNSFMVYVRGTNIYTHKFDDDLEWDPETRSNGIINLDLPALKSYTMGVKLSF